MALTMAGSAVDAWAEVAQNAVREGAVATLSDSYNSVLHIDVALSSTTAHTGTRVLVQVSSAAADDEFWTTIHDFITLVGTGVTEAITNNPLAAAGTQISVASLTGFTVATGGTLLAFLEDATPANSELVQIISTSVEAGDDLINLLDGVKREHANTAVLWSPAAAYAIELPMGTLRARVIYDNLYDADGSSVFTRARVTEVTAVT